MRSRSRTLARTSSRRRSSKGHDKFMATAAAVGVRVDESNEIYPDEDFRIRVARRVP